MRVDHGGADAVCGNDDADGGRAFDQEYFLAADEEAWIRVSGLPGFDVDGDFRDGGGAGVAECGAAVLVDVAWGADTDGGVWTPGGGRGVAFERVLLEKRRKDNAETLSTQRVRREERPKSTGRSACATGAARSGRRAL